MTDPAPPPRGRRTGGAIALITIGLLVLVPSGLCTSFAGIFLFVSAFVNSDDLAHLGLLLLYSTGMLLLFGGLPIALGAILLRTG